ncbi:rhomboid family intramembrane serine protease [Caldinitratiruptor microaerophilus]|uniref:Rhomboid family intramembrane serine protease n=1 Tax=Caldinitratiruptor microaerophilus TaxID=671077 RepID=A0AA35CJJ3_9FIRM|nr:rhomboid family intramembrane serine protease [Caldinitratiruptor microaerophilus]BDG59518.1 rhomboid family intramembrane serine protease [Caldinitratiruptor microaerophilus]
MLPLFDTVPHRSPPLTTWGLILANGLVFLLEAALPADLRELLIHWLGLVPARYAGLASPGGGGIAPDGGWPFLTSLFLHGGWVHLLSNMWALYLFGDNVEDRMGHLRFLAFYLLSGVAAGVTHVVTNWGSAVPAIGASGAVAGVMGAYMALFPGARIITLVPVFLLPWFVEVPAAVYLGGWFASQFVSGAFALLGPGQWGGVAWWAHVGGFLAGLLLYRLFLKPRRYYRAFFPDEYRPW